MCSASTGQEINDLKYFSSSSPSSSLLLLHIHFLHTGVLIRSTAIYTLPRLFIVKEKEAPYSALLAGVIASTTKFNIQI